MFKVYKVCNSRVHRLLLFRTIAVLLLAVYAPWGSTPGIILSPSRTTANCATCWYNQRHATGYAQPLLGISLEQICSIHIIMPETSTCPSECYPSSPTIASKAIWQVRDCSMAIVGCWANDGA